MAEGPEMDTDRDENLVMTTPMAMDMGMDVVVVADMDNACVRRIGFSKKIFL